MVTGRSYKAEVQIGNIDLGEIDITVGLDRTITLKFPMGNNTIGALDTLFRSEPTVTIDGEELESRQLQAYRVDASGNVEVSFLSDIVTEEETEENEVAEDDE